MRDDSHKVIIERPRWGSRMRNLKTAWSAGGYDPERDYSPPAITTRKIVRKAFSDRLGPLKRYLPTQVGRPWSKIEGEFRKSMDTTTIVGRHLWDHASRMVCQDVRMGADGRPFSLRGYPVRDFYVHPRTGLLLRPKPEVVDEAADRRRRLREAKEIHLDSRTRAEKVGDLWYLYVDEGRMEEVIEVRKDHRGRMVRVTHTRPLIRKKQASTREIERIRAALEKTLG